MLVSLCDKSELQTKCRAATWDRQSRFCSHAVLCKHDTPERCMHYRKEFDGACDSLKAHDDIINYEA